MSVPLILSACCRRCSKFRNPREFAGSTITGVCWQCYERHVHCLRMLSGAIPHGCQECNKDIRELELLSTAAGRADTRLVLEFKDGVYQFLCLDCDAKYQPKRRDLYGKTPHGHKKRIA